MTSKCFRFFLLGAVLLLPACSFTEESLWPSLTGEDSSNAAVDNASSQPVAAAGSQLTGQPVLGSGNFEPVGVTSGQSTGTFVGQKVVELRDELQRLQASIIEHNNMLQNLRSTLINNSQRYHGTIAAVNARLQVGTTPGNPILVQQFKSAQGDLANITQDIAEMNSLVRDIGKNSTMSSYLSESTHAAFNVSGAVDEDHRQLRILEDEVNRTDVLIDRLLKETSNDVRRQTNYVSTERANLNLMSTGIKSGEIYGGSLSNVALAGTSSRSGGALAGAPVNTVGKRPLVVIRFDRTEVPYQQALYNAVSQVLDQRPNAVFDLVAVAPTAGGEARVALNSNKARRHAEDVLRTLVEMGLPPVRVAISARTMVDAQTSEVHLYLR